MQNLLIIFHSSCFIIIFLNLSSSFPSFTLTTVSGINLLCKNKLIQQINILGHFRDKLKEHTF